MERMDEVRKKINEIDKKMAELFEERMHCSEMVANIKKENGMSILDKGREKEVIAKNTSYIKDPVIGEYYVNFITDLMNISKDYQVRLNRGMRVAYMGVEGAFAYIAAKRMFPNATLLPYPSFVDAYNSVVKGDCDSVVLPVENSTAGDVGTVIDLIFQGALFINQISGVEIVQNLLACKGATKESIKTVYSHPQALAQCSDFIRKHGYDQIEYVNTAVAAKDVMGKNDPTIAAIASEETAELYGLEIIEKDINTSKNNTTRFASFSRNYVHNKRANENFVLVFTVMNEAGSLAKVLNIIGSNGFNMRNLRSRPMKGSMWKYYFYAEIEGHIDSPDGKDLMIQLKSVCDELRLVGTYTID